MCIGGGSYSKCDPNLVPFVPAFIDLKKLAHQVDEFFTIDQLLTLTTIYTESLYLLSK
ncbi:hypothetical protein ['Catharanthus roseus' aster yellows phytoplasma]|uniref:hypothetical protein n=1 Tax='Catharanthus roseus' aster yellows phytoplasma TaxID=1193712 RepID=UPI001F1129F4|nr:hypothetical protein ['Catharanthus roseus' aster yellows phytoplasma]